MHTHPSPLRKNRFIYSLLSSLILLFTIVGCSASPTLNKESDYLLTITPEANDTLESLEAKYNGKVIAWEKGHYAVIGVRDTQGLESQTTLESNTDAFSAEGELTQMTGQSKIWAGGQSKIWAGGRSSIWSGGRSSIWSGGEYLWIPENTSLWNQIKLEEGHALAENLGYGVKIAIIDTGIDLNHPALQDALAPATEWWDFYSNDAIPQEEGVLGVGGYGHGTNVAGIVRQLAPRATILPIRILGPDGRGTVADLSAAIQWAVDKGAHIINLSLGSKSFSMSVAAAMANATNKGVFIISSAGNSGTTQVSYPASYANTPLIGWTRLSVTSIDANNIKSIFSSYGPNVELAAPGENVYGPAPDLRMAAWSGTSMAAPMASGALALALGEELIVSKSNLVEELKNYSYDINLFALNGLFKGLLGKGRLDVASFLENTTK